MPERQLDGREPDPVDHADLADTLTKLSEAVSTILKTSKADLDNLSNPI